MAKRVQKPNAVLLAKLEGLCKLLREPEPDLQLVIRRFSNLANIMGSSEAARQMLAKTNKDLLAKLNHLTGRAKSIPAAPK